MTYWYQIVSISKIILLAEILIFTHLHTAYRSDQSQPLDSMVVLLGDTYRLSSANLPRNAENKLSQLEILCRKIEYKCTCSTPERTSIKNLQARQKSKFARKKKPTSVMRTNVRALNLTISERKDASPQHGWTYATVGGRWMRGWDGWRGWS